MVSSVLAQAILNQKAPDLVGSFKRGAEEAKQGRIKELSGQALKTGGQGLDELTDLDPEIALALGETIRAKNAQGINDFIRDAKIGLNQLQNGDVQGAKQFAYQRRDAIQRRGGDTTQTDEFISLLEGGDVEGARQSLQGFVGMIDQAKGVVVGGRIVDPTTGKVIFESKDQEEKDRRNFNIEQQKLEERRLEREQRERQFQSKMGELKPGVQKILNDAQNLAVESAARSRSLGLLADDLERAGDIGGGFSAGFSEYLKTQLGTQDDVSEFRRRYNAIRSSEAVKNLPPGVASDKDIELALKGFPSDTAPASQLVSFLRGAQKLADFQREFNEIKSEFISAKGSTRGLLSEVKARFGMPNQSNGQQQDQTQKNPAQPKRLKFNPQTGRLE